MAQTTGYHCWDQLKLDCVGGNAVGKGKVVEVAVVVVVVVVVVESDNRFDDDGKGLESFVRGTPPRRGRA